jgi:zearalenone synthase (highly reducing iterative type I polyketide synthase)
MLEKGSILPNIHFDRPSKRIPFNAWNIQVPTDVLPWPQDRLKRVSVNSFGYGGTNAHTIIDDADQFLSSYSGFHDWQLVENCVESDARERLFVFGAPDESALRRMIQRFDDYLSSKASNAELQIAFERNLFLDRLAYTLSNRRSKFSWKASVTATTIAGLQEALSTANSAVIKRTPDSARLAFVFTGQGAQWAKMGMELMSYPVFSDSVHEADNYLRTHLGSEWSVITELQRDKSDSNVHLARISQPVCTVLQIALVELLKSWNIKPAGVVGHSSGEIAAAYCYGALSREDAWSVAYWRGKICSELNQDAPHVKGAMMAVGLSSEAAEEYIANVKTGKIVVACINSPFSVTISGDESGIDELQKLLSADAVFCRKLVVENAYHSPHMELIAEKYLQQISIISTSEAVVAKNNHVKMASSVTGELISGPAELGPAYWVKNFVSPVRFSEAVAVLLKDSNSRRRRRARVGESAFDLLLEVGPHAALNGPIRQILRHHEISTVTYTAILNRGEDATKSALHATGELYIHGVPVIVSAVNKQATQTPSSTPLIDLPTYSWNHSLRYWAESRLSKNYRFRKYPRHDLLGAPVADSNDKEPRWRNILRASEQPWMRDHVVYSSILYPGSGMIVMVLEAAQQLAQEREGKIIDSIKLENVRIGKAIVIPEDQTGVETLLQLRRPSDESTGSSLTDSWEFTVSSCYEDSKLDENSSGMVTVRYKSNSPDTGVSQNTGKKVISQVARQEYNIAKTTCTQSINPVVFYDATQAAGLKYGPAFQGLTEITAGSDRCVGVLKVPDWRKSNNVQRSHHLIHPTTLDIIFHSMFAAIMEESNGTEGKLGFKTAAVPIAFDSLIFYLDNFPPSSSSSPEQSSQFSTCSRVKSNAVQRDLIADIYVSDLAWEEPKIVVQGMRCRELPGGDTGSSKGQVKAPLGTLIWKPDIDLAEETSLKRYITESLMAKKDLLPNVGNVDSAVDLWEKEVSAVSHS